MCYFSISLTVKKKDKKQSFLAPIIFFWAGPSCNISKTHYLANFAGAFVIDDKRSVSDRKSVIYFNARHCSKCGVFLFFFKEKVIRIF